jgi:hypothetical protein
VVGTNSGGPTPGAGVRSLLLRVAKVKTVRLRKWEEVERGKGGSRVDRFGAIVKVVNTMSRRKLRADPCRP